MKNPPLSLPNPNSPSQNHSKMGIGTEPDNLAPKTLIFTYGTLKIGFSNHGLMEDLMRTGDAVFKGNYRTVESYRLVCGPYRVPFLLNLPGASGSHCVSGELYAVSLRGLGRLDELEGTTRGHYERLPINVEEEGITISAEAYFAHRNYAIEMWNRSGKRGYGVYREREATGYVKRNERPQNVSFLANCLPEFFFFAFC